MSSEEDWSIISSLSDLDDEGTIDSHEDHLPVDGGGGGAGNVSSIATLKIPVLESGSKERSDSGSSTVSGSTVLMSGTDKGNSPENPIAPVPVVEIPSCTSDIKFAGTPEENKSVPPSRIQSTIQYYEEIAREFKNGITSTFRQFREGSPDVAVVDENVDAGADKKVVREEEGEDRQREREGQGEGEGEGEVNVDTALVSFPTSYSTSNPYTSGLGSFKYWISSQSILLSSILTILTISITLVYVVNSTLLTPAPLVAPSIWEQIGLQKSPPPPPPSYFSLWNSPPPPPPPSQAMAEVLQLWNQFEETFDQIYGNGEKVFNKYLPNQKEFQESFKNLVAKTDDVRKYTAKKVNFATKATKIWWDNDFQRISKKVYYNARLYSVLIGKEVSKKSIDYGKFINYHSRILIKDYTQLSKVVTKRLSTDGQKWSKIVFIESTKISKLSYNKARDLFQDSHVILQNLVNNAAANVHQADLWAKERVSSVEKESTKKQLKSPKKQKNKKLIFQGKSRPGVAKVYLCKE